MNAKLKGFSEEVDLSSEDSQHFLVFETDAGGKFSIPVPIESIQSLIQELHGNVRPVDANEDPTPEEDEDEGPVEQQPETDFDSPPVPKQPVERPKLRMPPKPPLRDKIMKNSNELEIDPEDVPEGATVFGDEEPGQPAPFAIHEPSSQRPRVTEDRVPGL